MSERKKIILSSMHFRNKNQNEEGLQNFVDLTPSLKVKKNNNNQKKTKKTHDEADLR